MVQTKIGAAPPLLLLFFLCFHLVFPATTAGATANGNATIKANRDNEGRPTGFSLELIHRDSERSPYYSANLTDEERYERLLELSDARLQMFKSPSSFENANLTTLRPPLYRLTNIYMVSMRIGTGSAAMRDYFLHIDTGSSLTWTQCKPCLDGSCFTQGTDVFEPRNSPTYRHAPCNDPLCRPQSYRCVGDLCTYRADYGDTSFVEGVLSRDTFSFRKAAGGPSFEPVPNLAFGCTHKSKMVHHDQVTAGILGMNGDSESFAVQLAHAGVTNGLFSYCLTPQLLGQGPQSSSGYLRFGSDIPRPRAPQEQTPLDIPEANGQYYVTLLDISVGNQRLHLDPEVFRRRRLHGDGVIIDSGSTISHMVAPAFLEAKKAMKAYFAEHGLAPISEAKDTCFPKRSGVEALYPSMTFHFLGAKLEVPGIHMFRNSPRRPRFCWNLNGDDDMTLIGAAQQVNTRFTYDLRRRLLLFAPEDCARDA